MRLQLPATKPGLSERRTVAGPNEDRPNEERLLAAERGEEAHLNDLIRTHDLPQARSLRGGFRSASERIRARHWRSGGLNA